MIGRILSMKNVKNNLYFQRDMNIKQIVFSTKKEIIDESYDKASGSDIFTVITQNVSDLFITMRFLCLLKLTL